MGGKNKYKSIRVMPDYSSSGLWNEDRKGTMIELDDLNLPPKLRMLFVDWIELYEESWNRDYSKMDEKKCEILNKRGLKLAKMLKEIYPDTKVTYWGESSDSKMREKIEV